MASATAGLCLGIFAALRNPNRRAADPFVLAMFFFFLASVANVLLRNTSATAGEALLYARLFYFSHMLAVGYVAAFVGIHFHGFRIMKHRGVNLLLQVGLLMAALTVALLVNEVEATGETGTVVESPLALEALAILAFAYGTTAMAVLMRAVFTAPDSLVRRQALLMGAGVGIHGTTAATYSYFRLSTEAYPPPILAATAALMALLFTVAVTRYHLFSLTWTAEGKEGGAPVVDPQPGRTYVVHQRTGAQAIDVFTEAVRHGRPGLCITRIPPDRVREEWNLRRVPVLWLSGEPGQNRVPPTHLDLMLGLVEDFLKQDGGVVLLEGLEYILHHRASADVIEFHQRLVDLVVGRRSTLLLALDPGTVDAALVAELERESEVIDLMPRAEMEEVFVMEPAGLLVAHAGRGASTKDADILSGLLSAIQDFARESFRGQGQGLRKLDMGERSVLLESGPFFRVAAVLRGSVPAGLELELRLFVRRLEARFSSERAPGSVLSSESIPVQAATEAYWRLRPSDEIVGSGGSPAEPRSLQSP